MSNETRETHPTFGMINFSRVSGAGRLFGSPLPQHFGTIRVKISAGERVHEDGEDRYRANQQYVEIEMSAAQFAEAITCMNLGDGVPCTVWRVGGKSTGQVPDTEASETDRAEDSFRERVNGFVATTRKRAADVKAILAKERLTKADREAIGNMIDAVVTEVHTNAPFFVTVFTESAGKVVSKAKAEIAAMMDHAIRVAGLEHIRRLDAHREPEARPMLPLHPEDR